MITKDEEKSIQELKARGYSQSKVAKALKISRSTVQRHWGEGKFKLEELFVEGRCRQCNTPYPKPKYMYSWQCPACGLLSKWRNPWF